MHKFTKLYSLGRPGLPQTRFRRRTACAPDSAGDRYATFDFGGDCLHRHRIRYKLPMSAIGTSILTAIVLRSNSRRLSLRVRCIAILQVLPSSQAGTGWIVTLRRVPADTAGVLAQCRGQETFTLLAVDDLGQRVRGCVHLASVQMPTGVVELRGSGPLR